VSLNAGDQARLRRIEAALEAADPALAVRFRRWSPSGEQATPGPGWSEAPVWVAMVFLVGFTTWMVAPAVGVAIAVVGGCCAVRRWARTQEGRRGRFWGRSDSSRR
jgi:Protein of unknown function (DUF3040)